MVVSGTLRSRGVDAEPFREALGAHSVPEDFVMPEGRDFDDLLHEVDEVIFPSVEEHGMDYELSVPAGEYG